MMKRVVFFNFCTQQNKKFKTLLNTLTLYFWNFYWPRILKSLETVLFIIHLLFQRTIRVPSPTIIITTNKSSYWSLALNWDCQEVPNSACCRMKFSIIQVNLGPYSRSSSQTGFLNCKVASSVALILPQLCSRNSGSSRHSITTSSRNLVKCPNELPKCRQPPNTGKQITTKPFKKRKHKHPALDKSQLTATLWQPGD